MTIVIIRALFLAMLAIPLVWLPLRYYQMKAPVNRATYSRRTLILNSAVLYALSFNLIFFLQELFLALGKKWLGLRAVLYHNNHDWQGEHPLTALAQGYGALSIFLAGILFFILFHAVKTRNQNFRLLLVWLSFQGFAQSLPQIPIAFLAPDTDTGQAFAFLNLNDFSKLAIAAGSIVLYIVLMQQFSSYLLTFAQPGDLSTDRKRFQYLRDVAGLASLVGILLIIPFRLPPIHQIMAPVLVTVFAMPWVMLNFRSGIRMKKSDLMPASFSYAAVVALVILLLIFQLILAKGVVIDKA